MNIPTIPFLLALLLSAHGWRKKSLSASGAATAFVVGLMMMAGGTRAFGVALIGFYLVGSRATKYGKEIKRRLEDGYHEGGYRSGWQVLSNSFGGLVAAVLWNAAFAPSSIQGTIARWFMVDGILRRVSGTAIADGRWCPVSSRVGWSRQLIFTALGHFACCLGDTLASELGILSRSKPRLITTFREVPPGTNGGVTAFGTFVSVVGGGIIGFLIGATVIVENRECAGEWKTVLMDCLGWGLIGGGFGSLLDSLLGATVQLTRYSREKKVVLQDDSQDEQAQVISGLRVLSNNQVNVVSSVVCAGLVGWLGGGMT